MHQQKYRCTHANIVVSEYKHRHRWIQTYTLKSFLPAEISESPLTISTPLALFTLRMYLLVYQNNILCLASTQFKCFSHWGLDNGAKLDVYILKEQKHHHLFVDYHDHHCHHADLERSVGFHICNLAWDPSCQRLINLPTTNPRYGTDTAILYCNTEILKDKNTEIL